MKVEEPDFTLSGKLAAETNTYKVTYFGMGEARKLSQEQVVPQCFRFPKASN